VFDNRVAQEYPDGDFDLPVDTHLRVQDVESYHGLYWKHDGVLEAHVNKMHGICGCVKPRNFTILGSLLNYLCLYFHCVGKFNCEKQMRMHMRGLN
jgi:hypothetical protein